MARINEYTINQAEKLAQPKKYWANARHDTIITHSSRSLKKFFYSTNHCQGVVKVWQNEDYTVDGEEKNWLGVDDWVACTTRIPYNVAPSPEFPDGLITTKEQGKQLMFSDYEEIPNPEPEYQPW